MSRWMPVDIAAWYRMLHPRPVFIVGSCSDRRCSAMAASWVTPVSRSPPMLAVAIAEERYTYSLIRESGQFSVIALPWEKLREAHFLGTVSAYDDPQKLEKSGLSWVEGRRLRVPVCLEALAVAECIVENDVPAGDHRLVLGRVVEIYAKPGLRLGDPVVYDDPLRAGGSLYARVEKSVVRVEL